MKVIDLLNKIAKKEELPERIKVYCKWYNKEVIYFLTNTTFSWQDFYMNEDDNTDYCLFENNSINLNDEVEILEEEKKIPEKLDKYADVSGNLACDWTFGEKKLKDKINEIIDCLDYLKSKGE